MVKYKKSLIVTLLAVAVGAAAWFLGRDQEPQMLYEEAVANRGAIEVSVLATGVVQPRNRLEIKLPVAGRIEEVAVREGQNVTRGQLLAWMSSSERAALLDAASAKGREEFKRWQELYRPTPIYAPMHGTVIARNVEPGQTVGTADAVLVMSDRLAVKAKVDETDIAKIRRGQQARITLDAYPDRTFSAVVEQIAFDAVTVDNVTTYEVHVLPQNAPPFMRSGMTANVTFIVSTREDVVVVPTQAIQYRDNGTQVLVPGGKNGAPVARPVKLGASDGRSTEILSGIDEGDTVLVPQVASNGGSRIGANPFGVSRSRTRR